MKIQRFESDLLCSNMYMVIENDSAIVIDPIKDTSPGNGLTIEKILLTHEHYDHISGVNDWKAATGASVLCSSACAVNIQNPKKNLSHYYKEFCELQTWMEVETISTLNDDYSCYAEEVFEDEGWFKLIGHEWHLFEMPGHSLGSIGIMLDEQFFFSGDSLIDGYEIELRMPGGSKKQWEKTGSVRLASVPQGVKVYPGHFFPFTNN